MIPGKKLGQTTILRNSIQWPVQSMEKSLKNISVLDNSGSHCSEYTPGKGRSNPLKINAPLWQLLGLNLVKDSARKKIQLYMEIVERVVKEWNFSIGCTEPTMSDVGVVVIAWRRTRYELLHVCLRRLVVEWRSVCSSAPIISWRRVGFIWTQMGPSWMNNVILAGPDPIIGVLFSKRRSNYFSFCQNVFRRMPMDTFCLELIAINASSV